MLQPAPSQSNLPKYPAPPVNYSPVRTVSVPTEQATIGRSIVIKGEVSGAENLYIDGRVEGAIHLADNRVTIGRNGSVAANITAKEVVIMGTVQGNIECTDRLDIRGEGSLTGDVVTPRICVEDGAVLKGSVEVKKAKQRQEKTDGLAKPSTSEAVSPEKPKAAAAGAGA